MSSSLKKPNDLLRLAAGDGPEAESAARQLGKLAKKGDLVIVSSDEHAAMQNEIKALRQELAALAIRKIQNEHERPWWNPERVILRR